MEMNMYRLEASPKSNAEAIIQGDKYRITVLTTSLIRLEYNKDGKFEDRATQMVLNRDFPVPEFQKDDSNTELTVYTDMLEIHYDKKEFSANGLYVKVKAGNGLSYTWYYGQKPIANLGGTARTLDGAQGKIPLENGIIGKRGYSVIDDSHSTVICDDGWMAPREKDSIDLYFFGYGHKYLECLKDFYYLCGKTPLLPRYALGNWWSRYYRYDEKEYIELFDRFEKEKIPFSVAVIDMDWHLVDSVDPKYGSGWTGYTWNRELFPDPVGFLNKLHKKGLKVSLNLHPADGIRAYEECYPRIAEKMGIDPESEIPVEFDFTDPEFVKTYFNEVLHPMEEEGVDFWWLDWQQGSVSKIPGLDPLWILNHLHYLDSKWKNRRPITFSRYAGLGSHRYPIGFSGDAFILWQTLQFEPYFTSTASNAGYGWWSHDIGGHVGGIRDDEMVVRWVQFGVFSPIMRLHSTNNPFISKEPWKFDAPVCDILSDYLRLRYAMVPYLYSMNRRASREGIPLILPMYYMEPDEESTYQVPNEYYFGSEMIAAPITRKLDGVSKTADTSVWLPEGLWVDFFTGLVYRGGRMLRVYRELQNIPVFMKAGAIVPMKNMDTFDNSVENPEKMEIRIFPAEEGSFVLWEDEGDTPEDMDDNWVSTRLSFTKGECPAFTIEKAVGNVSVIPKKRSWKLVFYAVEDAAVKVMAGDKELEISKQYHPEVSQLILEISDVPVEEEISVMFTEGLQIANADIPGRCRDRLEKAQAKYNLKAAVFSNIEKMGKASILSLQNMDLDASLLGELCEILLAQ